MMVAGVPLPDAMQVTGDATNNAVYRVASRVPRGDDARRGASPRRSPRRGLFPAAAQQMFRVGEDTGTLDEQLTAAADYFEPRARLQDQALHRPLRAHRDRRDGCGRGLRRYRPGVGDVWHLPSGSSMSPRAVGSNSNGETLLEVLITVMIVGIGVTGVLFGILTTASGSTSSQHYADTREELTAAAARIQAAPYQPAGSSGSCDTSPTGCLLRGHCRDNCSADHRRREHGHETDCAAGRLLERQRLSFRRQHLR